jgi:hypothetical protein
MRNKQLCDLTQHQNHRENYRLKPLPSVEPFERTAAGLEVETQACKGLRPGVWLTCMALGVAFYAVSVYVIWTYMEGQ